MGDSEQKSSINWGGLGKGLLAGAAIVAGIYLVSPTTVETAVTGLGNLATQVTNQVLALTGDTTAKAAVQVAADKATAAAAEASAWTLKSYFNPLNYVSWASTSASSSIESCAAGLITKLAGVAAVITGINYLTSEKEEVSPHTERFQEAKESFAVREDMRKMQTVMMARMQASGHEPAMAAANQQGRV